MRRRQFAALSGGDRREAEGAIPVHEDPQLQVADRDRLGLQIAAQKRHAVDAHERIGSAKDEIAVGIAHVEAIGP